MTKRIPGGAKRGRPKKPPRPERPRQHDAGRPETPLCTRPYRYALAYCEALATIPISQRAAILLARAAYNGAHLTIAADGLPKLVVAAQSSVNPLDAARTDAEIAAERDPFKLAADEDPDKHLERCRDIARQHAKKPADLAWLRSMGSALRIAAGLWHPEAREMVLRLAASANETAWAKRVLLPMLDRKRALAA